MKKILLKLVFLFLTTLSITAQDKSKSFDFKKGEVLDIILLTSAPESEELFERYKKTAFPVAFEYSYQPQPGFNISELTLGTHHPSLFLFGKWGSKTKREGFLANIATRVPDFHAQRRALFPEFRITYYEMPEDVNFVVDSDKHNVGTAFWKNDTETYAKFLGQWQQQIIDAGGTFVLQLQEGESPIGYYYNPTMFSIVEWENEAAFDDFATDHPLSKYEVLKNVHQFVID